jgi:hypothetical protein
MGQPVGNATTPGTSKPLSLAQQRAAMFDKDITARKLEQEHLAKQKAQRGRGIVPREFQLITETVTASKPKMSGFDQAAWNAQAAAADPGESDEKEGSVSVSMAASQSTVSTTTVSTQVISETPAAAMGSIRMTREEFNKMLEEAAQKAAAEAAKAAAQKAAEEAAANAKAAIESANKAAAAKIEAEKAKAQALIEQERATLEAARKAAEAMEKTKQAAEIHTRKTEAEITALKIARVEEMNKRAEQELAAAKAQFEAEIAAAKAKAEQEAAEKIAAAEKAAQEKVAEAARKASTPVNPPTIAYGQAAPPAAEERPFSPSRMAASLPPLHPKSKSSRVQFSPDIFQSIEEGEEGDIAGSPGQSPARVRSPGRGSYGEDDEKFFGNKVVTVQSSFSSSSSSSASSSVVTQVKHLKKPSLGQRLLGSLGRKSKKDEEIAKLQKALEKAKEAESQKSLASREEGRLQVTLSKSAGQLNVEEIITLAKRAEPSLDELRAGKTAAELERILSEKLEREQTLEEIQKISLKPFVEVSDEEGAKLKAYHAALYQRNAQDLTTSELSYLKSLKLKDKNKEKSIQDKFAALRAASNRS